MQHGASESKETALYMWDLQPRATPSNGYWLTRNEQVSGSSPLVGTSEIAATATFNLHGPNRGIGAAGPKAKSFSRES